MELDELVKLTNKHLGEKLAEQKLQEVSNFTDSLGYKWFWLCIFVALVSCFISSLITRSFFRNFVNNTKKPGINRLKKFL